MYKEFGILKKKLQLPKRLEMIEDMIFTIPAQR